MDSPYDTPLILLQVKKYLNYKLQNNSFLLISLQEYLKYILDVKVWDAEKYSGYDFGHRDYRLDNVSVQITLTNQEDEEIHSALGLTEYGMFRYDVMAKETTLDPALWKLKNTYNVKITVTLGNSEIEKNLQFVGIPYDYEII